MGAGGSSGAGTRGAERTAADKRAVTCVDWNESSCNKPGRDSFHCGYGPLSLRHGCAKVLSTTRICWKNHKERDHKD